MDYVTITGLIRAVDKGPQSHRADRARSRRVPVWSIACVFVGVVLMAVPVVWYTVVLPVIRL